MRHPQWILKTRWYAVAGCAAASLIASFRLAWLVLDPMALAQSNSAELVLVLAGGALPALLAGLLVLDAVLSSRDGTAHTTHSANSEAPQPARAKAANPTADLPLATTAEPAPGSTAADLAAPRSRRAPVTAESAADAPAATLPPADRLIEPRLHAAQPSAQPIDLSADQPEPVAFDAVKEWRFVRQLDTLLQAPPEPARRPLRAEGPVTRHPARSSRTPSAHASATPPGPSAPSNPTSSGRVG